MDTLQNNSKALTVLGLLTLLIIPTIVIPFISKKDKVEKRNKPLILRTSSEFSRLAKDNNGNEIEDWRELVLEETSTTTKEKAGAFEVTKEIKGRLNDPNNLTASFSKNIFTASAYVAKNKSLSKQDQEDLVSDLLTGESNRVVVKTYTMADLSLTKEDTNIEKKAYGNAIGVILKKANDNNVNVSDLLLIAQYTKGNSTSSLSVLANKKVVLDSIMSDLLKVRVPISAVPYHLLLLNKTSAYATMVDSFSKVETDPVRTVASFNDYATTTKAVLSAILSIQDYLLVEKISYTPKESGYILTSGNKVQ